MFRPPSLWCLVIAASANAWDIQPSHAVKASWLTKEYFHWRWRIHSSLGCKRGVLSHVRNWIVLTVPVWFPGLIESYSLLGSVPCGSWSSTSGTPLPNLQAQPYPAFAGRSSLDPVLISQGLVERCAPVLKILHRPPRAFRTKCTLLGLVEKVLLVCT